VIDGGRIHDGRDANSFANVRWIFGLHDRPWPERAVFGTVRTMPPPQMRDQRLYLRDRPSRRRSRRLTSRATPRDMTPRHCKRIAIT
jgi:hypothetical protein